MIAVTQITSVHIHVHVGLHAVLYPCDFVYSTQDLRIQLPLANITSMLPKHYGISLVITMNSICLL